MFININEHSKNQRIHPHLWGSSDLGNSFSQFPRAPKWPPCVLSLAHGISHRLGEAHSNSRPALSLHTLDICLTREEIAGNVIKHSQGEWLSVSYGPEVEQEELEHDVHTWLQTEGREGLCYTWLLLRVLFLRMGALGLAPWVAVLGFTGGKAHRKWQNYAPENHAISISIG